MITKMKQKWLFWGMLLLLVGCAAPAKVEKATSQKWHGGAAGSGGGINYVVYVAKPSNLEIVIDQVWVGDREKGWLLDFRVLYPNLTNLQSNHTAPKGVTAFTIEFREITPGPPNPRGDVRPNQVKPFDSPPGDLPETFDKGAVVYYRAGSDKATWVISDFQQLETLNYP
jgi:hypothetical protein